MYLCRHRLHKFRLRPGFGESALVFEISGWEEVIDDRPQPLICGHVAQSVAKSLPYPGYGCSGARLI